MMRFNEEVQKVFEDALLRESSIIYPKDTSTSLNLGARLSGLFGGSSGQSECF